MGKQATIFLIFFSLMDIFLAASPDLNSSTDEHSLLAIKAHIFTSDPNNIIATNWSQETSFCTWIGVTCSRRRPRVTALNLFNMSLQGTIAKEIGNLSFLTYVNLRNNSFHGVIPDEIGNLRHLRVLQMAYNQLSGEIPLSFGFLTNLERLILEGNHLTGTIPPSIGNLSNLIWLGLGDNNFQGKIPTGMGLLSNLTHLGLEINKLNGEMPQSIFNLSRLKILSLDGNGLTGKLPFFLNGGLPNLQEFRLSSNRFNGRIPNSISNLTNLKTLDLAGNFFTGIVPITLGNLLNLKYLDLQTNQLTNDLSIPEQDFLTSLTKCKRLKVISISNNYITGVLPKLTASGNLSTSLEQFLAYTCRISGILPNEIGNMSNLIWLDLGDNEVTGMIPTTFGQLTRLQRLDLSGNKLQGSIPNSFCNLRNMYHARLSGNRISGQLPACIGNLLSLRELYLTNNAFNSNIPTIFWSNARIQVINFSNNFFDGPLPREIGNLGGLTVLDLSANQFSGEIPYTFGLLESLNRLALSNNKLQGPIPESFASLKALQYLDLSHNNLSGKISKFLEMLIDLSYFNVSFNNLSGEIPNGGSFKNFTTDLFKGNNGLCGSSHFNVEICKYNTLKSSTKNRYLKYILPLIVAIALTAIIVTIIVIMLRRYHARKSLLSPLSPLGLSHERVPYYELHARKSLLPPLSNSPLGLTTHERVSYYELLRATNNLDEVNLIWRGSLGSVYKGIFSNGMTAAIKVFDLDVQGALKSFKIERHILSRIRHRNLVKVITSCSNLDFKALVLEYMPNGNLDQWLYSQNYFLSITQRLGIMIGVASAIEYLHQDYSSPIIHCDLKPSNILLDEDMMARVGDFGIAKLLRQGQRRAQTKTLGTFGYMAPGRRRRPGRSQAVAQPGLKNPGLRRRTLGRRRPRVCRRRPGFFNPGRQRSDSFQAGAVGLEGAVVGGPCNYDSRRGLDEYGSTGFVSTSVDVYSYGILLMETFTRKKPTDEMFLGQLTLRSWVFGSLLNGIMEIVDVNLLNVDGENIRAKHEMLLTLIIELALECTTDLSKDRLSMKDVLVRLKKIKTEVQEQRGPINRGILNV
ncbi:hypothetical protein RD792_006555 [Penstemon davidsonii]|uniref:Protein kinase domain-containing protein n=1 Tax=Penstemon davidsonii TaxID=160366 RepID=A0ABR0DDE1_9LAMI|nr:hypothetical protein RD792_006555 [Penstemon davidsonii]